MTSKRHGQSCQELHGKPTLLIPRSGIMSSPTTSAAGLLLAVLHGRVGGGIALAGARDRLVDDLGGRIGLAIGIEFGIVACR